MGASSRIYEIMQEPIEPTEALSESKDVTIIDGELVFEHVDFKYDVKRFWKMCHLVFHKVSAFVGPSGSGKSTILI